MVIHDLATSDLGAKVSELAGPGGCHGGPNWMGCCVKWRQVTKWQRATSSRMERPKGNPHCPQCSGILPPPKRYLEVER